jgi:hypothetical protein
MKERNNNTGGKEKLVNSRRKNFFFIMPIHATSSWTDMGQQETKQIT